MKLTLSLLGALMLASSARADVTYSIRRLSLGSPVSSLPETHVYVTDDAMLTQSWKFGYASLYQEDTLSLPKQKKRFIINRNLNTAKVEPLPENWQIPGNWGVPTRWDVFRDMGQERMLGFNTHHFRLERLNKAKKPFLRNDIWVASASELDYWPLSTAQVSSQDVPSVQFFKWAAAGLIVRNEFWSESPDDRPVMEKTLTWEVGSFTPLLVEPSFYTVPKGAKILSADAYTGALQAWNKRILSDKSRKPMMPTTT